MQLKKGNQTIFDFYIRDRDGLLITDLSAAIEIKYAMKEDREDADIDALILKKLTLGEIAIDTPVTGVCRVTLTKSDTEDLGTSQKFHALQIEYSAENIQEVWIKNNNVITDTVEVVQDVVR